MELGCPRASPQLGLRAAGAGEEGRTLVLCGRDLGGSGGCGMAWSVDWSDLLPACSLVLPFGVFLWDTALPVLRIPRSRGSRGWI